MRHINNDQISALAKIAGKNNADIAGHNKQTIDGVGMRSLPPEVVEQYVRSRNGQFAEPPPMDPRGGYPPYNPQTQPPQWPPRQPPPQMGPQQPPPAWTQQVWPPIPQNIPPPQPQYPEHRLEDNPMFYDMSPFEVELLKQTKIFVRLLISIATSLKRIEEYYASENGDSGDEVSEDDSGNFQEPTPGENGGSGGNSGPSGNE